MSSGTEVDIHEELAGAAMTPLHKTLGILITLITLFDGYDTFNPAYVIQYVKQSWGLSPSQAGISGQLWIDRLSVRRHGARHGGRPVWPSQYAAGGVVDCQRFDADDRDVCDQLRKLLRFQIPHRPWPRRVAAARHHLHQRTRAATRQQPLFAVGRDVRLVARRRRGRSGRGFSDADLWLANPVFRRNDVDSADARRACSAAGEPEVSRRPWSP